VAGKPHLEQDQIGGQGRPAQLSSGRSLESDGNIRPREMVTTPKGVQNPAYRSTWLRHPQCGCFLLFRDADPQVEDVEGLSLSHFIEDKFYPLILPSSWGDEAH